MNDRHDADRALPRQLEIKLLLTDISLVDEYRKNQTALFSAAQELFKARLHVAQRAHRIAEAIEVEQVLTAKALSKHTAQLDGGHRHGL